MTDDNKPLLLYKEGIASYGTDSPNAGKRVIFCVHGNPSTGCCAVIQDVHTIDGSPFTGPSNRQNGTIETNTHCHRSRNVEIDKRARRKLIIASILCVVFMIGEIIGGCISNSLAIATDAAHLLTDFASFMISLFALWVASRPPTRRMPFGWHRAEVIGALTSVLLIWVVTGILVYMAVQRVIYKEFEIDATVMLITSAIGVLVNLVMGLTLHQHGHSHGGGGHGHSHGTKNPVLNNKEAVDGDVESSATVAHSHPPENINVRAAFIHVLGDFLQSFGVLVAAIVIYFKPEWSIVDPICTFLFSILVLITTFNIIKDTMLVLMEGSPRGVDFQANKAVQARDSFGAASKKKQGLNQPATSVPTKDHFSGGDFITLIPTSSGESILLPTDDSSETVSEIIRDIQNYERLYEFEETASERRRRHSLGKHLNKPETVSSEGRIDVRKFMDQVSTHSHNVSKMKSLHIKESDIIREVSPFDIKKELEKIRIQEMQERNNTKQTQIGNNKEIKSIAVETDKYPFQITHKATTLDTGINVQSSHCIAKKEIRLVSLGTPLGEQGKRMTSVQSQKRSNILRVGSATNSYEIKKKLEILSAGVNNTRKSLYDLEKTLASISIGIDVHTSPLICKKSIDTSDGAIETSPFDIKKMLLALRAGIATRVLVPSNTSTEISNSSKETENWTVASEKYKSFIKEFRKSDQSRNRRTLTNLEKEVSELSADIEALQSHFIISSNLEERSKPRKKSNKAPACSTHDVGVQKDRQNGKNKKETIEKCASPVFIRWDMGTLSSVIEKGESPFEFNRKPQISNMAIEVPESQFGRRKEKRKGSNKLASLFKKSRHLKDAAIQLQHKEKPSLIFVNNMGMWQLKSSLSSKICFPKSRSSLF